jgi:hypothetical protein
MALALRAIQASPGTQITASPKNPSSAGRTTSLQRSLKSGDSIPGTSRDPWRMTAKKSAQKIPARRMVPRSATCLSAHITAAVTPRVASALAVNAAAGTHHSRAPKGFDSEWRTVIG